MWLITDPRTQKQVGKIEELMRENGDGFFRATFLEKVREFPAPPFLKTQGFLAAQAWIETQKA